MILVDYPKARFNYELIETLEAGVALLGGEVKSLKGKRGSLDGSHVSIRGGEAYVVGMNIPPYQPKNMLEEYDPLRVRKLLLTKKEITELAGKERQGGIALVPTKVFLKGNKIKIQIAVARGKKKHDKRASIRKREDERGIRRLLKR